MMACCLNERGINDCLPHDGPHDVAHVQNVQRGQTRKRRHHGMLEQRSRTT